MTRLFLVTGLFAAACGGPSASTAPTPAEAEATPEDPLEAFVTRVWMHGVPYDQAVNIDPASIPRLLTMLSDPAYEPHWTNVVVTLGMMGDASAVGPLIAFLEAPGDEISDAAFRARAAVPVALGYIVNRSADDTAYSYLAAGIERGTWAQRCTGWKSPWHADSLARNRHLRHMAVLGLGVSGDDRAANLLALTRDHDTDADFQGTCDSALGEHEKVRDAGLQGYYRKLRHSREPLITNKDEGGAEAAPESAEE